MVETCVPMNISYQTDYKSRLHFKMASAWIAPNGNQCDMATTILWILCALLLRLQCSCMTKETCGVLLLKSSSCLKLDTAGLYPQDGGRQHIKTGDWRVSTSFSLAQGSDWGCLSFSCDQNNHDSSGAYVTCSYCNGHVYHGHILLESVVCENNEYPKWSSMADVTITQVGMGGLESLV